MVKQGVPVSVARRLQKEVGLTQKDLARTLGVAHRTFVGRMKEKKFDEDESDRVLRLKRVFEQAVDTFEGDKRAAVGWLQSSNRALGGQVPLELLSTSTGARAVEQVLGRIEHGIYS